MIQGSTLRDAFISGANNIAKNRQRVDELNVFPVPDGDTGTNMSMTIGNAAKELAFLESPTVAQTTHAAASALLRGARGNSGVILSLLFRGFASALKENTTGMDADDICDALAKGVKSAYKAVMKPTEGTMLTVAREASESANEFIKTCSDPVELWAHICEAANRSLENTPNLLPVLKKAGVVDAGGQGLCFIFEGMLSVFRDGVMVENSEQAAAPKMDREATLSDDAFLDDMKLEDIENAYCTEFIVNKEEGKKTDAQQLRGYLESIGDSVVLVEDEEIIKAHVHTNTPGDALQAALQYGYLTNMKIENMREQFAARAARREMNKKAGIPESFSYAPVDPSNAFGFVSVCAGEGLKALFEELGVNNVVSGGQTMNPSTDDILKAVEATPAKTVFVLPNNKNIIMAAEQAINLADRKVVVLQTRSIPQGVSAMLAFDPEATELDNTLDMTKAFERVGTGLITFAARDSDFDDHKINKGEILAMENGKLAFTEKDAIKATVKLTRAMIKKDSAFVTLFYGEDITEEQAEYAAESLRAKLPDDIEVNVINGGQPVYYFMISVE